MHNYGTNSMLHRGTTSMHLRNIFDEVLPKHDHSVTCGSRIPDDQQEFYKTGRSKVPGRTPNGEVSPYPHMPREGGAWAIDVWPYIDGRALVVPDYSKIREAIFQGEDNAFLQNAIGRYCQFAFFAAIVLETAEDYFHTMRSDDDANYRLVWGGNWDEDSTILTDQGFDDFPHFQQVPN